MIVGELAERPEAVLGPRLSEILLHHLATLRARLAAELTQQILDVHPRVPQIERLHRPQRADRIAIRPRHCHVHPTPPVGAKPEVASGHSEARHEALQIPLKRPRQRLVEIVDVEHQPPVGRGERAKVRQVGVTAQLHAQPTVGRAREIRRHQVRGTPIKGKRRDQHPAVANRHELRHTRRGLFLQQLNRIAPIRRRRPLAVHPPRHFRPRRLPSRRTLRHRQVSNLRAPTRTACSWPEQQLADRRLRSSSYWLCASPPPPLTNRLGLEPGLPGCRNKRSRPRITRRPPPRTTATQPDRHRRSCPIYGQCSAS